MKKIILLLLVILIMIPTLSVMASDVFTVKIDTKEAMQGDIVEINVELENNPGILAMHFDMTYDTERLELISAQDTALLEGSVFSQNTNVYPYVMLWNSASPKNFTKDGTLVNLNFKVKETAKPGQAFIKLEYDQENIFDVDLNDIKLMVVNGAINIKDNEEKTNNNSSTIVTKPSNVIHHGTIKENDTKESIKTEDIIVTQDFIDFIDVNKNDWFYKAVKYVAENKITQGTEKSKFSPYDIVTRGQFITMLCRAYNLPQMQGDNFADCGNTWYTGYLATAKQMGISKGVGNNLFFPESAITREEMVTLLYNYLGNEDAVANCSTDFIDKNEMSEWAVDAIGYAKKNGIIQGKENNLFKPKDTATRAELAQIFYNIKVSIKEN